MSHPKKPASRWRRIRRFALVGTLVLGLSTAIDGDGRWTWGMWITAASSVMLLVDTVATLRGPPRPTVIPMFREEDWPQWRTSCDDTGLFSGDFHVVEEQGLQLKAELEGRFDEKAILQVIVFAEFEEWARANGLRMTAATRTRYAEEIAGVREPLR